MPEWFIRVEFDPSDREAIEQLLGGSRSRLIDRDGETYLRDEVFDGRAERYEVEVLAEAWLGRISSLVRTVSGRGGIRCSGVRLLQADGRLVSTVCYTADASWRVLADVDLSTRSRLLEASRCDEALSRVLDILAMPNRGWLSRTHLLEIVEQDMAARGVSISDMGWATGTEIGRYRATVNSFEILGSEARHAKIRGVPRRHMPMRDAARLVDHLVREWLEWRRNLLAR